MIRPLVTRAPRQKVSQHRAGLPLRPRLYSAAAAHLGARGAEPRTTRRSRFPSSPRARPTARPISSLTCPASRPSSTRCSSTRGALSLTASSPFWVANNGTSTTQLIRGDVPSGAPVVLNPSPQTVTIPGGLPTGTVANPVAGEFVLPGPCAAAPCGANFLFASITGNITGWDPNAPAAGSTTAVIAASHPGHVYTGLAYANNGSANFLYAADFANGKIDVFNTSFALQPAASFPFADPTIPTTAGNTYHPYNIQAIGSSLYVAYAKVGTGGLPEDGVGNGFVRRFNANGVRDLTFGINNGALNSPWGITQAPASFGIFGGALLVGNFGEGNPSIHAYNPTTGAFLGTLQDESGNGIVIDELWDLKFGNGGSGGDVNTLYFTAGIGEEEHGLFGKLNPTTASATSLIQFADDRILPSARAPATSTSR